MPTNKRITLAIPDFPFALQLQTHGEQELISQILIRDKLWEAFETRLVIEHLNQGDVFIDVGANIGYYSVIASKLVGSQGTVFSFEPEKLNFFLLEKNIALNALNNVQLFNAGLGNQSGSIDFYISPDNRGDHRAFDHSNNRKKISVDIVAGDEILQKQTVDFIKIDTQGYELEILQGLSNTITRNQQHLKMIIEFWPFALKENGHSAHALLEEIASYDFNIYMIDHIKHQLVKTDIEQLKTFAESSLTVESEGFVNLFLSKKHN